MDDHDRELIERAGQVPGGHEWLSRRAFAELIVGLKEAVKAELLAANELTGKIHRLNQSLLWRRPSTGQQESHPLTILRTLRLHLQTGLSRGQCIEEPM